MAVSPGRIAFAKPSGSEASKKSRPMPRRVEIRRSQSWAAWYMTRGATTWRPLSTVSKRLVIAAMPEPKSRASAPPSSSAKRRSARSSLGLRDRA